MLSIGQLLKTVSIKSIFLITVLVFEVGSALCGAVCLHNFHSRDSLDELCVHDRHRQLESSSSDVRLRGVVLQGTKTLRVIRMLV